MEKLLTRVQNYYLGTLTKEDKSLILNELQRLLNEGVIKNEDAKKLNLKILLEDIKPRS